MGNNDWLAGRERGGDGLGEAMIGEEQEAVPQNQSSGKAYILYIDVHGSHPERPIHKGCTSFWKICLFARFQKEPTYLPTFMGLSPKSYLHAVPGSRILMEQPPGEEKSESSDLG